MLIDISSGRTIDRVPYRSTFDALRDRLTGPEFDAMVARINELIDEAGGEIATAGWLPGSDWTGTPFEPIYLKAARGDFDRSAQFFGQLVWYTIMQRPERWASGRYQLDGKDIGSRTYFRVGQGMSRRIGNAHPLMESGVLEDEKNETAPSVPDIRGSTVRGSAD